MVTAKNVNVRVSNGLGDSLKDKKTYRNEHRSIGARGGEFA